MSDKYYKVVFKLRNGWRVSAGDLPVKSRFNYHIGKVNRPLIEHSKFFVFEDISLAIDFASKRKDYAEFEHLGYKPEIEVWEVEATDISKQPQVVSIWGLGSYGAEDFKKQILPSLKNYWRNVKKGYYIGTEVTLGINNCWNGGKLAGTIKFLKKLS